MRKQVKVFERERGTWQTRKRKERIGKYYARWKGKCEVRDVKRKGK